MNITLSFQEKIEKANKDFCLFDGCKKLLVGLSGGADSTCLLLCLKALSEKYGFSLFALHVNHMIRAEEAERDEEFARTLCKDVDVAFFSQRIDVPRISEKSGESLELCARNERYKAFERICKENGISHVATAHNACDNTETVVFNLVRGAGTKGMCGIPPKRVLNDGITVIRPLIYAERCEIEQYLEAVGQTYVTDSTNSSTDYTRNYIRNEILPLMKSINPSLDKGIMRSSQLHRKDDEYLEKVANRNVSSDIQNLSRLHESILSRVVIKLFSQVSCATPDMQHVKKLCSEIYTYNGEKKTVSFPDGMFAKLYKGKLSFEKDERRKRNNTSCFEKKVTEGEIFFEDSPYALYITLDQNKENPQTLKNGENIYKIYTTDYLYFDKIPLVLVARNKRDGDKILSNKMHKSLKRLLCASCFDGIYRDKLPIIEGESGIVLVPGVCMSDKNKTSDTGIKISVSLYIDNKTEGVVLTQ